MDILVLFRIDNVCLICIEMGFWLFRDCIVIWDMFICGVFGIIVVENFRLNLMFNVYRKFYLFK